VVCASGSIIVYKNYMFPTRQRLPLVGSRPQRYIGAASQLETSDSIQDHGQDELV
jgi:hypothetical protein